MGIFHSCQSTSSLSSAITTAKLILQDGELREFSRPIKVSQVLQNVDNSANFICDSDDIDFGQFVSAINEDEELQLGQLYFVLPSTCLNRPFQSEDMAALAIKASAAFRRTRGHRSGSGSCCASKGVETLEFAIKKDVNMYRGILAPAATVGACSDSGRESVRRRREGGGGDGGNNTSNRVGRPRFVTKLNVIVEEISND
ncbi:uncharacterized protein LOC133819209 [Humulus lupulus]|uniref:uncharacterized protein LOC133819209 n=1 Tax=Humulus lupulus TaxID=3486 RepID=UPI002B402AFA|nr:uncharacterized protein LOC133819209 [Humulus lupulus]